MPLSSLLVGEGDMVIHPHRCRTRPDSRALRRTPVLPFLFVTISLYGKARMTCWRFPLEINTRLSEVSSWTRPAFVVRA